MSGFDRNRIFDVMSSLDVTISDVGDICVDVDQHARGLLLLWSESVSIVLQSVKAGKEIERKRLEDGRNCLKLPADGGRYKVMVILDDMDYCVATSEPIASRGQAHRARVEKVPYLVLKDTNLLCFNVYMPLQPLHLEESSNESS